jgi:hypothetical protein
MASRNGEPASETSLHGELSFALIFVNEIEFIFHLVETILLCAWACRVRTFLSVCCEAFDLEEYRAHNLMHNSHSIAGCSWIAAAAQRKQSLSPCELLT